MVHVGRNAKNVVSVVVTLARCRHSVRGHEKGEQRVYRQGRKQKSKQPPSGFQGDWPVTVHTAVSYTFLVQDVRREGGVFLFVVLGGAVHRVNE